MNIQTFTYRFFLATYKLCGSQTFKELYLCMWILPGTSLFPSLCSQISLVWDNLDIPVCIFCKWGASTGSVGLIHPPPCEHAAELSPQSLLLSALRSSTAVLWQSLSFLVAFSTFVVFIQAFLSYAPHLVLMWCAFKKCINKGCNFCASVLGMDI